MDEVRLIRDKMTGESRGFAFVDFVSPEDAQSLMEHTNGSLTIDGSSVTISLNRTSPVQKPTPQPEVKDWICPQVSIYIDSHECNASNFARRKACFTCNLPKPIDAQPTQVHPENDPSSILIVRGLDFGTTEQTVLFVY